MILVSFGIYLKVYEDGLTPQRLLYETTRPTVLVSLLTFAAFPVIPGIIGLWLARWRIRKYGPTHATGIAVRFSKTGISLAILIVGVSATSLGYRWLTWG